MQTIEQRSCFLSTATQWFGLSVIAFLFSFSFATQSVSAASNRNAAPARRTNNVSSVSCAPCERERKYGKAGAKLGKKVSCHPKGYVDPKIAQNYKKAIRDLHHAGIQPKVTSTWRSTTEQAGLHDCSLNRNCRARHPGLYYALPPGHSLHEAGFAVDIAGVAAGPRGSKRTTPQGRRIISVMRKNGFKWRYGLKDPAHFEADPTHKGYRSVQQAIHKNQTTCTVKLAKAKAAGRSQTAVSHSAAVSRSISRRTSAERTHRRNSRV